MNTFDNFMNEIKTEDTMNLEHNINIPFNLASPTVLRVEPLKIETIPLTWDRKIFNEIKEKNSDNIKSIDNIAPNSRVANSENSSNECPFKETSEKSLIVSQNNAYTSCNNKVDKDIENKFLKTQQIQLVKSFLLSPFLSQNLENDINKENFLETILRITEDKMYLYGFYGRTENKKSSDIKKIVRKKRSKTWDDSHYSRKGNIQRESQEFSHSENLPFSFVKWSYDNEKMKNDVNRILTHSTPSSSILTTEEKQTFSRYALSSGKLRKECADPYQFLSAKLLALRHSLEEEFATEIKNEGTKKETT